MKGSDFALSVIVALGLLGGIGYGIKAWYERKLLRATASGTDATATAVIVAAARELVDPLRAELATERRERAMEAEADRRKLAEVRVELEKAIQDAQELRLELVKMRQEVVRLQTRLNELGHP